MWVVFEAVPTKLPHYVLPLYPALAILVAVAAERKALAIEGRLPRIAMGLLPLLVIVLTAVAAGAAWRLDAAIPFVALPILAVAIVFALLAWRATFDGRFGSAAMMAVAASLFVAIGVYQWTAPLLRSVAISPRLAEAAKSAGCTPEGYATVGYREPSLVLLTRTDLLMTDGPGAASFLRGGGCRVAFVEGRQEAAFLNAMDAAAPPRLISRVQGLNLNGGRKLDIGVYRGP
jgi:4-amino-4-deoxy-L-arabinose transferase-like glycosyltransferase